MNKTPPYGGQHWLIEFHRAQHLENAEYLRDALAEAVDVAGATLLHLELHHFGDGQGVTGAALLAESHISIHTWPEHGYAAIDVFMCGKTANPQAALDILQRAMAPEIVEVKKLARGYGLTD